MAMHHQAIYKWKEELEGLWEERQSEFISSAGRERVEAFEQTLNELKQALEENSVFVDDCADAAFKSWQQMTEETTRMGEARVGMHTLPPLPYQYGALEPYIDGATMRIHHDQHHRTYVNGLNKAEREMARLRQKGEFELLKHWEREAAFHGAGHYLHTLFWNVMSPNGGGEPKGELLTAIKRDFGSFTQMKQHFSAAAEQVEGGGWALLVWVPRAHKLEILQAEKHQNLSQQDQIPLLALDVWEHAYYLKHQANRKAYIQDWWNVVFWPEVENRFKVASKVKWEKY